MSANWRSFGDVSFAEWAAAIPGTSLIRAAGGEVGACYAAAKGHTRLCLGMLTAESSIATRFNADPPTNKNALNLRPRGGSGFLAFASWAAGLSEWRARLTDPTYAYAPTTTLSDLINVYAPSSDANNVTEYIATVEAVIAAHTPTSAPGGPNNMGYPSYSVAGLSKQIVLPVPLIQAIIPASQVNQRPGIKRQTPGFWVQHETANTSPGADAAMHARYLANGGNGGQVSWHFTVDDHQIYQHIPIDEVTWQAADGAGPGNMSGVSCELCVNVDGDKALIRRNGEALCGTICAALGLTVDQIKRHWDFNAGSSDRHHCPDQMMSEGYWPSFVANAGVVIAANQPGASTVPTPAKYAKKHPLNAQDARTARLGKQLTVTADVQPRQAADPNAPVVGPTVKAGGKINVGWWSVGTDGKLWVSGTGGSFFPYSTFL